jgi:hypothetical protein
METGTKNGLLPIGASADKVEAGRWASMFHPTQEGVL